MNTEKINAVDRIDIYEVQPEYYRPLLDLDKKLRQSRLSNKELLIIYIRSSQINGCAYCIQSHIKEAIELGEKQYRIHALNAWEDSPFFTEEEQTMLKMTDEITNISNRGLSSETYNEGIEMFGSEKVADIIMAITCINAWNRIGRATQLTPYQSQD